MKFIVFERQWEREGEGEGDHVHTTAFVEIAGVNTAEGLLLFQKSLYGLLKGTIITRVQLLQNATKIDFRAIEGGKDTNYVQGPG